MHCPNCNARLYKALVESHYGLKMVLDQCLVCGGIWCNNFEMYRVSLKSGKKIDKLNTNKLEEIKPIRKKLICPNCRVVLKEYKNPYFPKQIKLEYCSKCGGFWLNRGELARFKDWQEAKNKFYDKKRLKKDNELAKQIRKIIALRGDQSYELLTDMSRVMFRTTYLDILTDELKHLLKTMGKSIKYGIEIFVGATAPKAVFAIFLIFQVLHEKLVKKK